MQKSYEKRYNLDKSHRKNANGVLNKKREILAELEKWKGSNRRKPLILTGVRQCGKTYVLKEFGKNCFKDMCYINFEESSQISAIFEYDFDVKRIIKELTRRLKVINLSASLPLYLAWNICEN